MSDHIEITTSDDIVEPLREMTIGQDRNDPPVVVRLVPPSEWAPDLRVAPQYGRGRLSWDNVPLPDEQSA